MKIKLNLLIVVMISLGLILSGCGVGDNNPSKDSSDVIGETSSDNGDEEVSKPNPEKTEEEIRKEVEKEIREKIRKEEKAKEDAEIEKEKKQRKAEDAKKAEEKNKADTEKNKLSIRANFNSGYLEAGGFTLDTTITNTSKKVTAKIKETAIRLIDVDGNIINPITDRLAQTIEIQPQSDGIVSTFFHEIEPEFISTVEVTNRKNEVIASYDFDSSQIDYSESEGGMENLPEYVAMTENGLILWSFEFRKIDGFLYLVGVVENSSNKEISMVSVSFDLFDEGGYVVGTSSDSISSLARAKKWKFKAPVFEDGVYTANFKELSSW